MINLYRLISLLIDDSHKRVLLMGQLSMPTTQYLAFQELVTSEIDDVLKLEIQHLLVNNELSLDIDEDNSSESTVKCNI